MRATLQGLSVEADPRGQVATLKNWQRQWQQCGYPLDSTYINGLLQLELAHHARGELVVATQLVQQAIRLAKLKHSDVAVDQPAKALYRLGMLLSDQNQPAMNTLKQAVREGKGVRAADRWVGNAYLYLAYGYYSAGDFQQAINSAESGELIAGRTNDRSLMIKLLQEKIKALNVLERYQAARQAAEKALALSKQEGYPAMIARAYRLLGVIAENQEQLASALRYRQRAFEIARMCNDPSAPDYAVSVGIIYQQLQQYDKAISYFQYGLDSSANSYAKAFSLTMLGQVYQQKKAFSRALQYYQRGLTIMPLGFRNSAITSLPDAQSIRLADQKDYLLTLIQNKADAWLAYAKATANNQQRLQHALNTYKIADEMIDFMRWDHTAQESKLYWRDKTRGMYERAIETCYKLNDAEQAFRFFEKSRAVMLADKLNELGARQQLSGTQAQKEKALREAVSLRQQDLATLTPDSARYKSVSNGLNERQDKLDTFIKELEASNPSYYRYKYDTTIAKLDELQRYLTTRNASFVSYFVGDSALYWIGVTGNKAILKQQPIGHYKQATQAFMTLLADADAMNKTKNLAQFVTLGNELYRQLLAPLHLPKGSLIISPDGVTIPFETLSLSATKPAYLLNEYAFSYVYSARRLARGDDVQARTNLMTDVDFLGVAPVTFAPTLGQVSLLGSDKALEPIAGRFRSSVLLTHKAASRRAFLTQAANARIIHLFTHASADSAGSEPTLYFADSTLQLFDLGNDGLPHAQLVVLAACKTGVGANQRGEGVFSLARGFAALGVPSVLTTLWSVENKATYDITNLFYKHLDEGLPKDVALQRAKQEWLEQSDRASPTQWAGLILVGDTQPLDRSDRWFWMAGGGLLLVLLAFLVWQFRRRHGSSSTLSYGRLT